MINEKSFFFKDFFINHFFEFSQIMFRNKNDFSEKLCFCLDRMMFSSKNKKNSKSFQKHIKSNPTQLFSRKWN